ncbi:50S ribosomal protein L11 methyltransferase [Catellatospora sp. NPDC049609]|uniref:class I SAM-dependent methyltransferase n=1 Tax=Catellatospora sp. NPDC049609 TaxID=3155505 RepID=UPI00342785C8
MTALIESALEDLQRKTLPPQHPALDRLCLSPVPLVPEIRLHLAVDAVVWWARMEAEAKDVLPVPYWASAWAGGQAVARYVLDNPATARGRHVLDLAAGSGLAGIAAGLAGAATVTVNDTDPYAVAAALLNGQANGVDVTGSQEDLLVGDDDGSPADLVLAGDVFYSAEMATRVLPFLHRAARRGATVLVGDPGRDFLPADQLVRLAGYDTDGELTFSDAQLRRIDVYRLDPPAAPHRR